MESSEQEHLEDEQARSEGSEPVAAADEAGEVPPAGEAAENDENGGRRQYSGVGARVTAVLTAAEKAAEQMLTLAREEADGIRGQAQAEAEGLVERRRFEAEDEARQRLAQAEVEADGIRARAEAEGREIEAKARMRQERFLEETRLLADRVEWARGGLRDITARLGEVLYEPEYGLGSPQGETRTAAEPGSDPGSPGWERPDSG